MNVFNKMAALALLSTASYTAMAAEINERRAQAALQPKPAQSRSRGGSAAGTGALGIRCSIPRPMARPRCAIRRGRSIRAVAGRDLRLAAQSACYVESLETGGEGTKMQTVAAGEAGLKPLRWEAHACLPLVPGQDMSGLSRYHEAGFHHVSLNVGMDMTPFATRCAPLKEITGQAPLPLFRAPGGKTSARLLQAARRCGYAHVGWSPAGFLGDELPSERYSNAALLQQALEHIRPGDILLAHLGIWSRKDPWAPAVLEPLIEGLKSRGFCFRTLREHPEYQGWIAAHPVR